MSKRGSTTAATPAFSSPMKYEAQPRSSWVNWRKIIGADPNPDCSGRRWGRPVSMALGDVLKRTVKEFQRDNLTDWAASLTYYAVLALFPALIFLTSILGLVGKSATQPLIDNLTQLAPGSAHKIVNDTVENLQNGRSAAGAAFVIGLVLALWSASGYIGAFIRASNAIYEVREGRPFYKLRPMQLG